MPRDKIIKGLHHLFSKANVVQGGVTLARPYAWMIWKNVVGEALDADALKHLLRISDDAAAELLKKLDLDPALKEELFESGRFLDLWALDIPDHLRNTFFTDFFDHPAFRAGILGNFNLVKAWRGLHERPEWVRLNTELLSKIANKGDDYITRVNDLYSPTVMKLPPNLTPPNNPPGVFNGIVYDNFGFPKLEPYLSHKDHVVKILMDGTNDDYIRAYKELIEIVGKGNIQFTNQFGSSFKIKVEGKWSDAYTWHHHQDGETMMPVLQTIHQSIQTYHTGGRATSKRGLVGLFYQP